jgi:hypothetical protein
MIIAVEGRPGMGKSVWLVGQVDRFLRANYVVYSNIEVKVPDKYSSRYNYFSDFSDLIPVRLVEHLDKDSKVKGIKIILDEMQVYLSSRNWDKLDQKFQLLLQQHRKRGIDIIGATQSIKRADVVFRELVQVFYRIHKITTLNVWKNVSLGFFYLREYDPDSIESQSRSYDAIGWPFLFFADPIVMRMYDTTQEVKLQELKGRQEIRVYVHQEKTVLEPVLISKDLQPLPEKIPLM